jgi:hypothetical protein
MLTADPILSPGLWLTIAAGGAALLAVYLWRRPAGVPRGRWAAIGLLMAGAFAAVLVLLLNPTWARPVPPPPGKPLLTILVDGSRSMATPDVPAAAGGSRYAAAAGLAKAITAAAPDDLEVRIRRFDEQSAAGDVASLSAVGPAGEITDIAGAVLSSLEADRPQGQAIVLLSDGIQTAEGGAGALRDAARAAKAAGAPVFSLALGGGGAVGKDVAVAAHVSRELVFIRQKAQLIADVSARGYAGPVTVRLLAAGRELARKTVSVDPARPASVAFDASQEAAGLFPYQFDVEPVAGELTGANNSALCVLRVLDNPVRVMLVEGKPYWDSKFLVRELAAEAAMSVRSAVQVAPGRVIVRSVDRPAATQASAVDGWQLNKDAASLLADPRALEDLQVLILGRETGDFLSPAAVTNLQRWISRSGGALVCYRGNPVTAADPTLARLLPVKWQPAREARYQLAVTDTGRGMNWFGGGGIDTALAALPPLAADSQVEQTKPLTVVLANARWQGRADTPAVSYQPYGAGRVVVIEGAGMWRWAFPPAPGDAAQAGSAAASAEAYAALWHAMFRWIVSSGGLVPGEQAAVRPDKIEFDAREPAAATVLVRQQAAAAGGAGGAAAGVQLRRVADGGGENPPARHFPCEPSGDDPGAYRVRFGPLPPGRYEATLEGGPAAAAALFDVKTVGEEELNLEPRPDALAMIASESGGAAVQPEDAAGVAGRVRAQLAAARPARISYAAAWDRPWVFAAVLALWMAAWAVRRASGLV